MMSPSRITKEFLSLRTCVFISGSNIHPNPHFYKYHWWIYAQDSVYENADAVFYKDEYRLNTYEAITKMEELRVKKIPYAYVNTQDYRLGCKGLNYDHLRSKYPNMSFAVAYEDDIDPPYNKHK